MEEVLTYERCDINNEKEQSLIENIKRLAHENKSIKLGLAKHNKLIEQYCDDLERLRMDQMMEKENMAKDIERLKHEVQQYRDTQSNISLSPESTLQNVQQFIIKLSHDIKVCEKEKSLRFPVQETQYNIQQLQSDIDQLFCSLQSLEKASLSHESLKGSSREGQLSQENEMLRSKEHKMNEEITALKIQLGELMKNREEINEIQAEMQELKESNAELLLQRNKLNKEVAKLHQRIEQLEVEPSVEVMQVTCPQQTKVIENLNGELTRTKEQLETLVEENECLLEKVNSLNEVCLKMSQDASQNSMLEGKEINQIKETYETAIRGLKDEIEKQQKECCELKRMNGELSQNLVEQTKLQSANQEESSNLKSTIEKLRKRESRDLDKLDQITVQRDTIKKELESKLIIIKELDEKIEALKAAANDVSSENVPPKSDVMDKLEESSALADEIEALKKQLSSNETSMGILSEENTNLKMALKVEMEKCCCQEMSAKIDFLVQENEELEGALATAQEMVQDQSLTDVNKVKELEERTHQLEVQNEQLIANFKQRQLKDSEIIQRLNEELMAHHESKKASMEEVDKYQRVIEDARQKIDVLDARLEKSKKDYKYLWQNYETKMRASAKSEQKLKEVEEQNKEIKMQQSKYASENYEKIRQMQQIVMTKDREIEKLKCELQNIDVFKAQVEIYEKDFKLERTARENQHSDMLLLREEVHRLELENNRLRSEVDSVHLHKVQELQRRYANSQAHVPSSYYHDVGVYGRGGVPVTDSGAAYNRSGEYGKGSIELPPQEPDQVMQRACPKCHAPFPDLDSLQIHVLECVD